MSGLRNPFYLDTIAAILIIQSFGLVQNVNSYSILIIFSAGACRGKEQLKASHSGCAKSSALTDHQSAGSQSFKSNWVKNMSVTLFPCGPAANESELMAWGKRGNKN